MSGNELSKTINSIKESSSILEKSLEDFHKENSRKVIRSNIRLLKKISNDYNLNYNKLYKEYIEVKIKNNSDFNDSNQKESKDSAPVYSKNCASAKNNKKKTKVDSNSEEITDKSKEFESNEKILSKIIIKGEGFWIDDNTDELYSLDFKPLGIHEK